MHGCVSEMVVRPTRQTSPTGAPPEYERPPVTEVVAGVYFDAPLAEFRIPHTGLFWHRVQKEFPHVQHAGPVAPGQELRWLDEITGLPMPRIWLLSEDKTYVIQIQSDCFFYNWRKQAADQEYPRYANIIASYERNLQTFLHFLKDNGFQEPRPMQCELTYVNHIPQGDGWDTIDDLAGIFKDFTWSKDKDLFPIPKTLSWSCVFDLKDNHGTLTARLNQVTRVGDPAQSLRLDLSCKGIGSVKSVTEAGAWFEVAHDWIVRGFADLTKLDAQKKLWGRKNV